MTHLSLQTSQSILFVIHKKSSPLRLLDGEATFFLVFAKAVDFFSAGRKQKINFSASTASNKEQFYMYV